MRTRLPLLPIALLLTGAPLLAQSRESSGPWYVDLGAGVSFLSEDSGFDPDDGFALHGALGYMLGEPRDGSVTFSLEAEYYYSESEVQDFPISFGTTKDDLDTSVFFGNLVADWHLTDATSMYFGGGVGYANKVGMFGADEDGTVAYQGKAGLRFQLGGGFSWSLGYRLVSTEDIDDANGFQNLQSVAETAVRWQL